MKYPTYFMKLLHGLKQNIEPTDKILTRFVLDAPDLREADLETIREFCEDSERMVLGLATLHDLVIQRSQARHSALRILLELCIHPSKKQKKKKRKFLPSGERRRTYFNLLCC
jgi:symplekin